MKRKLTMMLMTVVMLTGVLAGCGGKNSKHVEMSDRVRQDFIDFVEEREDNGDPLFESDGDYTSAIIFDYEINGAPIVIFTPNEGLYYGLGVDIIYRKPDGYFRSDFIDARSGDELYIDINKEVIVVVSYDEQDCTIDVYDTIVSEDYYYKFAELVRLRGQKDYDNFEIFSVNQREYERMSDLLSAAGLKSYDELRELSYQEFIDYINNEYLSDATPVEEFFTGDDVYKSTADLLDAWEEY